MCNHERHNGASHPDHYPRRRNQHPSISHGYYHTPSHSYDAYGDSERNHSWNRSYRTRDRDQAFHSIRNGHRKENRRKDDHGHGYGGRRSTPSPDGGSRSAYAYSESGIPPLHRPYIPPVHRLDPASRPDSYRHENESRTHAAPKSNIRNNMFKPGCPYINAPAPLPSRDPIESKSAVLLQNSAPAPRGIIEDSPQCHGNARNSKGSCKQPCRLVSPPESLIPLRSKPVILPLTPKLPRAEQAMQGSRNLSITAQDFDKRTPFDAANTARETGYNDQYHKEGRSSRSLSCEPAFRPEQDRGSDQQEQEGFTEPLQCAIAHPSNVQLQGGSEDVKQGEQFLQNDSPAKPSCESRHSKKSEVKNSPEEGTNGSRQPPEVRSNPKSVQEIFKKVGARLPNFPEGDLSAGHVEEKESSRRKPETKTARLDQRSEKSSRIRLRSVPMPGQGSPLQRKLCAEALKRALTAKHEKSNVTPANDYSILNGDHNIPSTVADAPVDSEEDGTHSSSERDRNIDAARRTLAQRTAGTANVTKEESFSAHGSEQGQEFAKSQDTSRRVCLDEVYEDRFSRGSLKVSQPSRRRTADFDNSRESRPKRRRPDPLSETIKVDDTTILRRSKRTQQFAAIKTWETTKFDQGRVRELFTDQLRKQPMLLRISFLGICDADLREVLDICRNQKGFPEPDQRRLEVNNNRIRRITDDMCTCISVLRAVSLNFSCNLLTTIGAKIGLSSKLRFLNLSRNQLSSLPQELCDLTNLEVLNMSHNAIDRLPSGFCRLKHLEVLGLAWNKLEVLPEDVAAEGAVLSDLDLSHNESFHFFPRCAEHWMKLEVLHLAHTTICGSLSRRELRLRPAALVKELAGRKQDMFNGRRLALRSQST